MKSDNINKFEDWLTSLLDEIPYEDLKDGDTERVEDLFAELINEVMVLKRILQERKDEEC